MTALAAVVGMTKQAMGQVATYLVGAGYLLEDSAPDDRRIRVLHLSARGREVTELILERMTRVEAQWAQRVGSHRYAIFRAVLGELG
ncbi:hypothetical protein BH24ACT12_BH24ACT12_26730 [soil metagenome]